VTVARTIRRLLFWVLLAGAFARFYALGEQASWAVVIPLAASVTIQFLAAWFLHLVVHEAGHLLASRLTNFELDEVTVGPFTYDVATRRWRWNGLRLGGSISILPRGTQRLASRLRWVAVSGPLATFLMSAAAFFVMRTVGQGSLTHPSGIALLAGGVVLISAATPGRLKDPTAVAGNDVDQILLPRRTLAHWTYLAVAQAVLAGHRSADTIDDATLHGLLPAPNEPPEALTVVAIAVWCARGRFAEATQLADRALERSAEAPRWVETDLAHQRGAIAALVEHEVERAAKCLATVRKRQTLSWYGDLLEACVARASQDEVMARKRLDRWLSEAHALPKGRLALGGNEWILERLRPTTGVF
jgi:hypothetical protein